MPSRSRPLYVTVMPRSQYCSSPARQASHSRHESTNTPTPTVSPMRQRVTSSPTPTTVPTISWPGTIGKIEPPHSSRAWWMSLWQTPQKRMSMTTSWGRGSRRSNSKGPSGAVGPVAA